MELRTYGQVRAGGEDRKRQFVISTEAKDRHGTVIRSNGWDLSGFAGTGFYQHDSTSSDPDVALGPARVWAEGKELIGEIDFEMKDLNPLADKVMRKIDNGTLKNTSVGFVPIDGEWVGENEDRTFHFTEVELTEFSVVGVPSNKEAVKRDAEMVISFTDAHGTEPLIVVTDNKNIRGLEAEKARLDFFKLKFSKNGSNGSSKGTT